MLYICIMYIDFLKEHELIQGLLKRLPRVDPNDTLVINVSPDYSSTVSMQIAHHLSADGRMLDMFPLDVPYPGESKDNYQYEFKKGGQIIPYRYHKVILVEAAVLSGNNYTWIKEMLLDMGYENDDIITVALIEMNSSVFKCEYVQAYTDTIPEFYWERYNKHWD
jgi:hypothetical protein